MPKLTADSFLNVLQQSDLIERDRIKSLMGKMQEAGIDVASSSAIGSWMVREGHLTDWQVDKLQKGKYKGFKLGKYRLRKLLGKGGMSSVYLAEHTLMRRPCAIKVLPIKKVNDSSYLARFHREAQAVASLDHPNIVRAYDIDKEVEKNQEIHFLIMEYVKGRDLQEVVKEDGPLSFEDAAEFCRQAALGLDHAHLSGLVHRDVKPGNLLLDENGVVKVLDLGLARFAEVAGDDEASLTVAHDEKVLGTADYLSPEQALDSHLVDNRADVYSLGCSMYFALTGRPPFNEGSIAQRLMWHQMKEPPEMKETRPDVPDSLAAITWKMMAKKPEDRYSSMGEVSTVLLNWLARNASAGWKNSHAEILSGSDLAAPTAMPVAPVAAPVTSMAQPIALTAQPVAPTAAPEVSTAAPVVPQTPVEPAVAPAGDLPGMFPGLPSAFGESDPAPPMVAAEADPVGEATPVAEAIPASEPPQASVPVKAASIPAAPITTASIQAEPPPAGAPIATAPPADAQPSADPVQVEPNLSEPATELLTSETVAAGASELDPSELAQVEAPVRRVVEDTFIDQGIQDAPPVEEPSVQEVAVVEEPTELEILEVAEPTSGDTRDEHLFARLPGGTPFQGNSVNEPTLITPPRQEPPAAAPVEVTAEPAPFGADFAVPAVEPPVAATPTAEPAFPSPVEAAAPAAFVPDAPAFPGPPPVDAAPVDAAPVDTAPAGFAPPDFSAVPAPEPAAFPDFSAQESAPAPSFEPPPAQPIAAAPVAEPFPAPAAPQPAFDPTAPAPVPGGFDPTAPAPVAGGFDPSAGFSPQPAAAPATSVRPQKKKPGLPVGLIAGVIVALALGCGAFYMFGGGGDDKGGDTQAGGGETGEGTSGQSGTKGGGTTSGGGPDKFLGYNLTVGPDGNFKTFASLLKYFRDTKSSYRTSRRTKIVVTVSGGKYAESIVVDNSDQKYPEGIQLIVEEGGTPAVLAPSGNGPVFKLTNMENFRLEGFEIDASGRDNAVELNGDVDRSIIKNVTISGYSKAGIRSNEASGSVEEEFVIENVRFNPSGGNSVGIVFAVGATSRFQIPGCRFLGPQNSAIVFESGASFVTIKDSVISQAGIGITFAGVDVNLRNISIFNNTFHDCSTAGLHFAAAPSEESFGSSEIAVHRNIFSKLGGAEAVIEKGYELKSFQKFVSTGTGGIQFNWSDRPTAANQMTEWELILRPEQRVNSFQFVSTDRDSADFLRPELPFPNFRPGGGSQRYPGAVQPK
jgi:tRNA A-37 threonylcarbamoyl transferase component Bud32